MHERETGTYAEMALMYVLIAAMLAIVAGVGRYSRVFNLYNICRVKELAACLGVMSRLPLSIRTPSRTR